jgi:hypothetical protein
VIAGRLTAATFVEGWEAVGVDLLATATGAGVVIRGRPLGAAFRSGETAVIGSRSIGLADAAAIGEPTGVTT